MNDDRVRRELSTPADRRLPTSLRRDYRSRESVKPFSRALLSIFARGGRPSSSTRLVTCALVTGRPF